ncbi:MAG: hypothetical protein HYV17_04390 [Xanthomonadales bacterium]|nr:hypothetical protein [Xanthomonadales bacterium]
MPNARLHAMLAPPGSVRVRVLLRGAWPAPRPSPQLAGAAMQPLGDWRRVTLTDLPNPEPACWIADFEHGGLAAGVHTVTLGFADLPSDVLNVVVADTASTSSRLLYGSCFWVERFAGSTLAAMISEVTRSDPEHNEPRPLMFAALLGDQVYLDLPTVQSILPRDDQALAKHCYQRYLHQWFDHEDFAALLRSAPVVMVPDDHELWNNAPRSAVHLMDTWTSGQRQTWLRIGRELFDQFQRIPPLTGEAGRSRLWICGKLHALFLDARLSRDAQFQQLFDAADRALIATWRDGLAASGHGSFGLLAIGQPLLDKDPGWFKQRLVDATLADYANDYRRLFDALRAIPHPVAVRSGDVHFGRVSRIDPLPGHPQGPLVEAICSPFALIPDGKPGKPSFDLNHDAFKQHGYTPTKPHGIRSASMIGTLSIELAPKLAATAGWTYVEPGEEVRRSHHQRLLPAFGVAH